MELANRLASLVLFSLHGIWHAGIVDLILSNVISTCFFEEYCIDVAFTLNPLCSIYSDLIRFNPC